MNLQLRLLQRNRSKDLVSVIAKAGIRDISGAGFFMGYDFYRRGAEVAEFFINDVARM